MSLKKVKNYISNALSRAKNQVKRLEETIDRKQSEIEKLRKDIEKLKKENDKLKDELKTARKSPPWAKPNKKAPKGGKPGKKKGPKKGHKPNKRKLPDQEPDQEITITPLMCPQCDHSLPEPAKWHSHTQIDIPRISDPLITTFLTGWSWCAVCKKYVCAKDKMPNTLYGPRLHAYISYLKFSMGLTLGKIQALINDNYGLSISTGEISEMIQRTGAKYEPQWQDIKTRLLDEHHIHADETGWRLDGNNHWLWSFASEDLSYYVINKSRGQKVVSDVLGDSYGGTLVTDFYSAYNAIDCDKQKCWAHLLRELRNLKEKYNRNREIRAFARRMKTFYNRGVNLQELYQSGKNIDKKLERLKGDTERWADKKHRHPDLKRLASRLHKFRRELYTFIKAGVDPTNNFGEREIRPAVLMRKTSYCNRSERGAETQSILMSVIATEKKRGQNFVETTTEKLQTLH